jgi:NAD(P)H dehydrogenase (quinone)
MHHAIIFAHPVRESFCASIAATCAETLSGMGHSAVVRDLYGIDFDPRLKASEIPLHAGFAPAPDVVAERTLLANVDSFLFIYPFWFNAPPAILKGYVDRVFGASFGFGPGFGSTTPLLGRKTLFSISTSGAPDQWVNSTGALDVLMQAFDHHIAAVCGLEVLDHIHFGDIVPNMRKDAGKAVLSEISAKLRKTFKSAAR